MVFPNALDAVGQYKEKNFLFRLGNTKKSKKLLGNKFLSIHFFDVSDFELLFFLKLRL